jgi:hypothetical protein
MEIRKPSKEKVLEENHIIINSLGKISVLSLIQILLSIEKTESCELEKRKSKKKLQ